MKSLFQRMEKMILFIVGCLPLCLLAQNPDPGVNPDARPQDVPFDGSLVWILIVAGVVVTVAVFLRKMQKKTAAN